MTSPSQAAVKRASSSKSGVSSLLLGSRRTTIGGQPGSLGSVRTSTIAAPLRSSTIAGSAVPILNKSLQRSFVAVARRPDAFATPSVSVTVASPAVSRWSRTGCSFDSCIPRCRATMTRLPSNDPVALPASSSTSTVDGSFNAKVTVSTTSSQSLDHNQPSNKSGTAFARGLGGPRALRQSRLRGRQGCPVRHLRHKYVAATELGFDQILGGRTAERADLFAQPRDDDIDGAIAVWAPRPVERLCESIACAQYPGITNEMDEDPVF